MEFNLTTFILEIINFLVLIWILQRLFYKPLLATIAKRKQHIEQMLSDAQTTQQQAEAQRELYENRQKLWEQEKQTAVAALHQQMDAERAAQLTKLQHELDRERQKHQVALARQHQEFHQHAQQQALKNGARFAALLLQQTASPELEQRLAELLLTHLTELPEACQLCLQQLGNQPAVTIQITSAYPPAAWQTQLEQRFSALITPSPAFHYQQDATLIAGLRLDIGAWVLQANLQQELRGFAELAHDFD